MPSLFRFLAVVAILGVVVYVGLYVRAFRAAKTARDHRLISPDKFFKNR